MTSKDHRILVVDDVPDNLFLLKAFLESEGYTVDVAESGSSALQKMRVSPPDLVMVDVMMPGMDGYEVTRAIRRNKQLPSIPIVLVTAHMEACRIKGLTVGATDFVRKPINFEELVPRIQNLLRFRGARGS